MYELHVKLEKGEKLDKNYLPFKCKWQIIDSCLVTQWFLFSLVSFIFILFFVVIIIITIKLWLVIYIYLVTIILRILQKL